MPEKYRLPSTRILSVEGEQVNVIAPFGFTGTNAQDLFNNMAALLAPASHTHEASDITSGTFADARISASSVTQHINDAGTGTTDLWSADKIATEIAAGGGGGGAVDSVFGRTGAVVAATSDYDANQIDVTPAGNIASTNVQAALEELDSEKAAASHTHAAADVTSGTFADARISQSSVTQHQAAIDHGSLAGLADDDHTQYLKPAVWAGGSSTIVPLDAGLTVLPLDAEDYSTGSGYFTMDSTNEELEVLEDGVYDINIDFTATKTVGTVVSVCRALTYVDTGSGFGSLARCAGYVKLRVKDETGTTSFGRPVALSAGDKIKVYGQITAGSNIDCPAQGYVLSVTRVGR